MANILQNTDTTSYTNMYLETWVKDADNSIAYHWLYPNTGYVLHDHENCDKGDEELGIEPECCYRRRIMLPRAYDLSLIPTTYEAVLESSVPADRIFGTGDNNHEIM